MSSFGGGPTLQLGEGPTLKECLLTGTGAPQPKVLHLWHKDTGPLHSQEATPPISILSLTFNPSFKGRVKGDRQDRK